MIIIANCAKLLKKIKQKHSIIYVYKKAAIRVLAGMGGGGGGGGAKVSGLVAVWIVEWTLW